MKDIIQQVVRKVKVTVPKRLNKAGEVITPEHTFIRKRYKQINHAPADHPTPKPYVAKYTGRLKPLNEGWYKRK